MVTFEIFTIFPDFFTSVLAHGVLHRALEAGHAAVRVHNFRDYTTDKHRTVDDRPFGGGPGMVLKPEPIFTALERVMETTGERDFPRILLSARGRLFDQECARRLSGHARIAMICGRYEGVDERVAEHLATEEISVGNFVLSGGELAACILLDSVVRLLPGVLGNEESAETESFSPGPFSGEGSVDEGEAEVSSLGLLDYPQYTRPEDFRGWKVPPVLLSGNHREIRDWRSREAVEKTRRTRPDVLERAGIPVEKPPEAESRGGKRKKSA